MHQWYVIKTKPHREGDVSKLFGLAQFEAFNPQIRSIFYRGSLPHFKMAPLFPSYIFLKIDFTNANLIHLVKYTRGVSKILCSDGKPHALDASIIDTIKSRIKDNGIVEYSPLGVGDEIIVKKGMLKDLIGILEKPCSADERVIVLLKLAHHNMKASLHWTEIERIKAA